MSTATAARPAGKPAGRLRLRGLTWLVWRQHRSTVLTVLGVCAAAMLWMAYQRAQLTDYLGGFGWPRFTGNTDALQLGHYVSGVTDAAYGLGLVPVVLGVFVGAPLFAADLENGTARLVTGQGTSRMRWIAAKFGAAVLPVALATALLSVTFRWWWQPLGTLGSVTWYSDGAFNNTGPVPTALSLCMVVVGMAVGLLLRRTLPAMVVTLVLALGVRVVWAEIWKHLGSVVTATTPWQGGTFTTPPEPAGAFEIAQYYVTSSGHRVPAWQYCTSFSSQQEQAACLHGHHVTGSAVDYLPISQMAHMQWTGAAFLLVPTVVFAALVFFRGCRRIA